MFKDKLKKLFLIFFHDYIRDVRESAHNREIYQSQDMVYIHHEFVIDNGLLPICKDVELDFLKSLITEDGAELIKIDVSPVSLARMIDQKKCRIEINARKLKHKETILCVDCELSIPLDRVIESTLLHSDAVEKKQQTTTIQIRNKKNWKIQYIKLNLNLSSFENVDNIKVYRVGDTTPIIDLLPIESGLWKVTWEDIFNEREPKTYRIEIFSRVTIQGRIEIMPYVNDKLLSGRRTVSIDPQKPFEALNRFREILMGFEGDVWWVEKQCDRDCLQYLNDVQDTRVENIMILTGSFHINENFKRDFKAFSYEMQMKGVTVELRVVVNGEDSKRMHDRYVFDSKSMYTMPPGNIITKTVSVINPVTPDYTQRQYFQKFWSRAIKLDRWKEIQEGRNKRKSTGSL